MRHSTIDFSLLYLKRASETQNHLTFLTEHQGTGYFMKSECIFLLEPEAVFRGRQVRRNSVTVDFIVRVHDSNIILPVKLKA